MKNKSDLISQLKFMYIDWDDFLYRICYEILEDAHKNTQNLVDIENLADSMLHGIFRYLRNSKFSIDELTKWLNKEYIIPMEKFKEKQ